MEMRNCFNLSVDQATSTASLAQQEGCVWVEQREGLILWPRKTLGPSCLCVYIPGSHAHNSVQPMLQSEPREQKSRLVEGKAREKIVAMDEESVAAVSSGEGALVKQIWRQSPFQAVKQAMTPSQPLPPKHQCGMARSRGNSPPFRPVRHHSH